jgi:hypothetical protein
MNLSICNPKNCYKAHVDPAFGIRDPGSRKKLTPDPGVKKGTGFRIRNIACYTQSTTVSVPSSELGGTLPPPLPQASIPPGTKSTATLPTFVILYIRAHLLALSTAL